MAVLLPNAKIGVRRRATGVRDTHGDLLPGAEGTLVGPYPARKSEAPDGTWTLAVDPRCWPVAERDVLVGSDGTEWTARSADLLTNSLDPSVDYIRVEAYRRAAGDTLPPRDPGGLTPA